MKTLTTILFCLLIFVVPAFAEDLETVSGSVVSEIQACQAGDKIQQYYRQYCQ